MHQSAGVQQNLVLTDKINCTVKEKGFDRQDGMSYEQAENDHASVAVEQQPW